MNPFEIRAAMAAQRAVIDEAKVEVQRQEAEFSRLRELLPPPKPHTRKLPSSHYYNGRIDPEELPAGLTVSDDRPALCSMCRKRRPLELLTSNGMRRMFGQHCPTDYSWAQECGVCDDLLGLI